MTLIGVLVIAAMVGLIGFAGLKLSPAYLENMKIKRILKDVQEELDGRGPTPQLIRRSIDRRLNIEMVYNLKGRDFEVEKSDSGYLVAARYEYPVPFIANVSLVVNFDDEVEIRQ
ncbi:MAG: DUF4845 domain-containing protein [Gammaproteobacteria bacterium]|nr:DUF4845 domain-containing protein [Gammaproteobacteria bacterium]